MTVRERLFHSRANNFHVDVNLTVSEWADRFRILSKKASNESGAWRTERTPYLRAVMDALSPGSPWETVVLMAGAQVGKALSLDTEILTTSGWKTMGSLEPGDMVFAPDGSPALVTGVSPVMLEHPCYDVKFSDGTVIRADAEHLWTVNDAQRKGKCATMTTEELLRDGLMFQGNRYKYVVTAAKPIRTDGGHLPLDPYVLGVWLGDGNSMSAQITQSMDDSHELGENLCVRGCVVEMVKAGRNTMTLKLDPVFKSGRYCQRGHDTWIHGRRPGSNVCMKCASQRSNNAQRGTPIDPIIKRDSTHSKLKMLGLLGNKHIPKEYMQASIEDRLDLLRGLMDTDGSVTVDGLAEFCSVSEALARGVFELISSLGYVPRIKIRQGTPGGIISGNVVKSCAPYFVVYFTAYSEMNPFSLERKASRVKSMATPGLRPTHTFSRRIVSISPAESVPVRCIAVAHPSRLYLATRAMIATHNTECGNNWIGFTIDKDPCSMIMVVPTLDMAKDNSKIRIDPLIEESPALRNKVKDPRARDSGNTILMKEFPGGFLGLTGANSPSGLKSKPIRKLFLDEIDEYPGDVGGQGDTVEMAVARTRTFSRRKIFMCSTPTIAGRSRIETAYEDSNKHRFYVPCPHCLGMQTLKWSCVKWPKGNPSAAWYECEHCGEKIFNHQKDWMLPRGEWRSETPEYKGKVIGFHISSLYSPVGWFSWGEAATMFVKAGKNRELLKVVVNTVWGEPWVEVTDGVEWEILYGRSEIRPYELEKVPMGGLLLTAGADVQKSWIEVVVRAWGRDKESWVIGHYRFPGNTANIADQCWKQLDELMNKQFEHESGTMLPIKVLAIDTGGTKGDGDAMSHTQVTYNWCRRYPAGRVMPVKGQSSLAVMVGQPRSIDVVMAATGKKKKNALKLWSVGIDIIKAELTGWLRLEQPQPGEIHPPGFVHFPEGLEEDFYKGLCSEILHVSETRTGRKIFEWKKIRDRNEPWDCMVYSRAATSLLQIDKFRAVEWDRLERAICGTVFDRSVPAASVAPAAAASQAVAPVRAAAPRRRVGVLSRGVRL